MWVHLYFTVQLAYKGSFTFKQRTEVTDQLSSVQGFIHSSEQHWCRYFGSASSLLQDVWPASTFAGNIPIHSGAPSRVYTSSLKETSAWRALPSPWEQPSTEQPTAPAVSLRDGGSPSSPPAPVKTGTQQPPPPHVYTRGIQTRNG